MKEDQPLDHEPTLREVFATLRHKQLYGNMLVHVFVLIPAATVIGFLGRKLDQDWGWQPIVGYPWNVIICLVCFAVGGFIVWYSYGYLFLKGLGSPGSHMGYTQRLVDTGIYSWIRHPSIIGKLIGVIGLSFLMCSRSFLLVLIPFLFLYSFLTAIFIQERFCRKHFGEHWDRYVQEVPMYIPRWRRIRQHFEQRRGP